MTIKHIVLLPFKSSLSNSEIEKVMSALADLQDAIPEVQSFSWGKNNSPENLHQGYFHGFVMEFKNDADRQTYLEHPAHVKVVQEFILPSIDAAAKPLVFDYDVK